MYNFSPEYIVYKLELCWWQVIEIQLNIALVEKVLVYLCNQRSPEVGLASGMTKSSFSELLQVLIWGKKIVIFLPIVYFKNPKFSWFR